METLEPNLVKSSKIYRKWKQNDKITMTEYNLTENLNKEVEKNTENINIKLQIYILKKYIDKLHKNLEKRYLFSKKFKQDFEKIYWILGVEYDFEDNGDEYEKKIKSMNRINHASTKKQRNTKDEIKKLEGELRNLIHKSNLLKEQIKLKNFTSEKKNVIEKEKIVILEKYSQIIELEKKTMIYKKIIEIKKNGTSWFRYNYKKI